MIVAKITMIANDTVVTMTTVAIMSLTMASVLKVTVTLIWNSLNKKAVTSVSCTKSQRHSLP